MHLNVLVHIDVSHNPYFNRWFSAIEDDILYVAELEGVTILILIDGFLQFWSMKTLTQIQFVTILILIDGFLQL